MIKKPRQQPDFISTEDLLMKLGYKKADPDRGLTVTNIRKNKRETILSVASARNYEISWLAQPLNRALGIRKNG